MSRAVLAVFAGIALALVALAIAPSVYHTFFCPTCRWIRARKREAKTRHAYPRDTGDR